MATWGRDAWLTLATTVTLLVGVGLVVFGNATLTVLGILLIIGSAIVFLVDVKDLLVKTDEKARK
ncbi:MULTISPECIES: hypothetical protein [Halorussus]|uniref:hypothetical protein n=1 Tax=Halorussus TaxID=1070314 RepID=UPI0020A0A9B9|nr:hypothetical protein [Halorussus vallis]USZ76094.1 hypothetical protein NGM07_01925 [Halorussus vallis]